MKKAIFRLILIFICILLIIFLIYAFSSDELSKKELIYELAKSEKFEITVKSSEIGNISFGGVIDSLQNIPVSDEKKIEKIVEYLSNIKVSNVAENEMIPLSADLIINIYNKTDTLIETIFIYKSGYIKRISDSQIYWIKRNKNVISEIMQIVTQTSK